MKKKFWKSLNGILTEKSFEFVVSFANFKSLQSQFKFQTLQKWIVRDRMFQFVSTRNEIEFSI
jgi:hypothetical protein